MRPVNRDVLRSPQAGPGKALQVIGHTGLMRRRREERPTRRQTCPIGRRGRKTVGSPGYGGRRAISLSISHQIHEPRRSSDFMARVFCDALERRARNHALSANPGLVQRELNSERLGQPYVRSGHFSDASYNENGGFLVGTGIAILAAFSFATVGAETVAVGGETGGEMESINQLCVDDLTVGLHLVNDDWVEAHYKPASYIGKKVPFPPATTEFTRSAPMGRDIADPDKEVCAPEHADSLYDPLPVPGTLKAMYPNVFTRHYAACMSIQEVGSNLIKVALCRETHSSIPGKGRPYWVVIVSLDVV